MGSTPFIREGARFENGILSFKNYVGTWGGPWDPEICLGNRDTVGFDPYLSDVANSTFDQCLADFNNMATACTWVRNPPTLPSAQYQNCLSEIPQSATFLRMGGVFNSVEGTSDVRFYVGYALDAKNDGEPNECVGNPINPLSGNKYQRETDYSGVGPLPLQVVRAYNSRSGEWLFNYEQTVVNPASTDKQLRRSDGKVWRFASNGSGGYNAEADSKLQLAEQSGSTNARWLLTTEDDTVESYDTTGHLTQITNRAAQSIAVVRNASGQIETVTDFSGRALTFTYNGSGRIAAISDPIGGSIAYTYDAQGRLTQAKYPDETPGTSTDNPIRQYHYENASYPTKLTGITDEKGDRYATFAYGSLGDAIRTEHAGGVDRFQVTRNTNGSVTVTNPLGKTAIYTTTVIHGVAKTAQIDGQASAMCGASTKAVSYDPNGFPDLHTDENGNVTDYDYNSRGLIAGETDALGTAEERFTTTTWHPTFRVPTQIVKPGQTVDMTYDTAGRLLTRTETDTQNQSVPYSTNGNTRTTTYTYNADGLVETIDGPRTDVLDVTTFAYDANDDLWTTTNALGQVTEIVSRDPRGLPTAIDDVNNVRTQLAYDARGRLTSRTLKSSEGDAITSFGYDAVGQVTSVTLQNGSSLSYSYDAAHRLTAVENNLGERIEYTLDAAGNRTAEVVKNGQGTITKTITRVFDELSRLRDLIGAATQTTSFGYHDNGNQTAIEDGLNRTTSQAYDALNRLITVTDPLLNDADYTYDDRDNLISVTDTRGVVTTYVYDGLDNRIQEASPDAGTSVHIYDAAGNRSQTTDGRGVVSTYAYDALNRVVAINYPADPSENISHSYDVGANGKGRLTHTQDASGSTNYSFDDRGNLLQEVRVIGAVIYATSYDYDLADNLMSMTYPSGRTVSYSRDSLGRVTGITTQASGGAVTTVLSNIGYLPFGGTTGWTAGSGLVESRSYDQDYRINALSAGGVINRTYSYTLADNIAGITDALNASRSQTFGYDELQRLTSASGIYGNLSYAYDDVGNRLTFSDGVATETSTYGVNNNRLTSSTSWDYQYDGGGNQTAKLIAGTANGTLFGYNSHNRMETVTSRVGAVNTTLATYGYNALGQRVAKASTATRHFVFDANGQLIAEADGTGAAKKEYAYLDGTLVAMVAEVASAPMEVIMDNLSAGTTLTGSWSTKTNAQQYATNYRLANGNNSTFFRWTPATLQAGTYEVYAWWVAKSTHNANVTYTIAHSGQSHQVTKNHRLTGGQWVLLGTYAFSGVGTEYVQVAGGVGGNSVADAVRFVQVGGSSTQTLNFVHTDHLGAPQAISNGSQQVVWQADYHPFGKVSESVTTISNNVRFPGQYFDMESGLNYNYFRDYDANSGRYVQSDPIGLVGGLNTYAYVAQNPVNFIDPYGLACNANGCWVTPREAEFAESGNYSGYYATACRAGDTYACAASIVANDDGLLAHVTNRRLSNSLKRNGASEDQCDAKMEGIRVDLAREHVKALGGGTPEHPAVIAREQISNFHNETFAKHGAGPVFGGDIPVFGNWPFVWCSAPSCRP